MEMSQFKSDDLIQNLETELDFLKKMDNKLFNVVKLPYPAPVMLDEDGRIMDIDFESPNNSFGIYKSTGGKPLGTVGRDYFPQQPRELFDIFCRSLRDADLSLSGIEYNSSMDESKIRFRIPLKTIEFKNQAKLNDVTEVFLNIQTGFDGKTKTTLFLETLRLVCMNGMKATVTERICKFKNTRNNSGKLVSLVNDIVLVSQQADELKLMYEKMDNFQINEALFNEYFSKVSGYDLTKLDSYNKTTQNVIDAMLKSINTEFNDGNSTLFAMFNGFTRYTNHEARNNQQTNPDYIFYAKGLKTNDDAFNVAADFLAKKK